VQLAVVAVVLWDSYQNCLGNSHGPY